MSILGTWSIGYVYYAENTPNNATMTITGTSPLAGTCTIGFNTMNIAAGAIVNVFNGQWMWFTCTEPGGEQYYFMGCVDPAAGEIYGGCIIPVGATSKKKVDGGVTFDPGDMAGWVASHQ